MRPTASIGPAADAAAIPFALVNGLVYVTAAINESRPLSCVLDTGASLSVVGPGLAAELRLTGREPKAGEAATALGPGQGGDQTLTYYAGVTLRLAGVLLRRQRVVGLPIAYIQAQTGHPTDAILGANVFRRFVVDIDYPGRQLRLTPPREHNPPPDGVPLTFRDGVPYVRAAVETDAGPIAGKFLIDSGQAGSSLLLTEGFVRAHPPLAACAGAAAAGMAEAVGGTLRFAVGEVPGLRIGGMTVERPVTIFPRGAGGIYADPHLAGVVGSGALTAFRAVFDYTRRRLWLRTSDANGRGGT